MLMRVVICCSVPHGHASQMRFLLHFLPRSFEKAVFIGGKSSFVGSRIALPHFIQKWKATELNEAKQFLITC